MIFRYLNTSRYIMRRSDLNFILKLSDVKDIWIVNCTEGCQFNMFNASFKINNLSKIIITSLHINNISGLLGLLSSLNLIGRLKSLHIYAPINLKYYLDLGKKYSRTNFSYMIYIHTISTGLIINQHGYRIYITHNFNNYELIISQPEQYGTFFLDKARRNYLIPGPLYGKLKQGYSFLYPDGFVLDGYKFTSTNSIGSQLYVTVSNFYRRQFFEGIFFSRVLLLG
uniref:Ribonuclease Z n=1 Tax=Osmundaria fimbriata TaxID=228265 RepID=A0A1Z1M4H7_OSMFI|nr:ribonuclease Z [Osmundaria fimbriata]ARW60741.1 ribonuclease Z [Osmundaria fimbriata]